MFKCTMDTMTCQVLSTERSWRSSWRLEKSHMFWMAWWIGYSVLRYELRRQALRKSCMAMKLIEPVDVPMLDWLETCGCYFCFECLPAYTVFLKWCHTFWRSSITMTQTRSLLSVVTCCHVGVLKTAMASEKTLQNITGWWFGTMEFHDFPETVGNGMSSSQLTNSLHHFSEG